MGKRKLDLSVDDILRKLLAGKLTVEEAKRELAVFNVKRVADLAKLDIGRMHRIGIPEAILGEGKDTSTTARMAIAMAKESGYALVTRAGREQIRKLRGSLPKGFELEYNERAKTAIVKRKGFTSKKMGRIGVLAAGTADVGVADEAAVAARVMGCEVLKAYDVGVAGIHRLFEPLKRMLEKGVAALVVVAGMEGSLPSVVASLVDVPVIGVPTSTGYGVGVKGLGALVTMLQSCSPKVVVVNIDNGYGGGVFAALIAKRRGY